MWEVADWPGLGRPERRGTSQRPPLQLHEGDGHNGEQVVKVVVSKEEDIFPSMRRNTCMSETCTRNDELHA